MSKDLTIIQKIDNGVRTIEKLILCILLAFMIILGMMQIISRFVIKAPISWSEAMLTYMFIWTCFIGASLAVAEGAHFNVDIFVNYLPKKIQRLVEIIVSIIVLLFALLMVYKGGILVYANRLQLMALLPFTMSWPYLALPASGFLISIHMTNHLLNLLRGVE